MNEAREDFPDEDEGFFDADEQPELMPAAPRGTAGRGRGGRLRRWFRNLLVAAFRLLLIGLIVAVAAGVVWYLVQEFQAFAARTERERQANREAIASVNASLEAAEATNVAQEARLEALANVVGGVEGTLRSAPWEALAADLAQQADSLALVEDGLNLLLAQSQVVTAELATTGTALGALQRDLNETGASLDALGGLVDGLNNQVRAISATLDLVQTDVITRQTEQLVRLERALQLFPVWSDVARARIHLAERNQGLAADDIDRALAGLGRLQATGRTSDTLRLLEEARGRLELAAADVADDPAGAGREVEATWDLLLRAIRLLVGPEPAEPDAADPGGAGPATPAATVTPTSAPAGTITPSVTGTVAPTATPRATASPTPTATATPGG